MLNFQFDPFTPFSALVLPLNSVSFFGFVPLKIGYHLRLLYQGLTTFTAHTYPKFTGVLPPEYSSLQLNIYPMITANIIFNILKFN